jgi:hypothetical protein
VYSYIPTNLTNTFKPKEDIKITIGKPKKTIIKANGKTNSFYYAYYDSASGKCIYDVYHTVDQVDVSSGFTQKSIAETDEDLLKGI